MADTQRNEAAIIALMADNITGDISPQDVRDFIVSVKAGLFNLEQFIGANSEMSIGHDATDGIIDASLVAPSDLHIDCGTDKTVVLDETCWDDLPPMSILVAKPGAAAPTLATFVGDIKQYTFDIGDSVFGATEVTHKYKEGTDLECHIHWASNGSEGSDKAVKWQLDYTIANANAVAPFTEVFPSQTTISVETVIPSGTASLANIIVDLGTITGTSVKIGAYILWRLTRIAAAGTDPVADPFALAVGFHIEQDTMGSRQEYIK